MVNPPKVISISWGGSEAAFGTSYITAFNTEAVKLAAMGVTLIGSSADDGSPSSDVTHPKLCRFTPDFPCVSPYVTTAGATMGPEDGYDEVACQGDRGGLITTGGGFSNYYSAPTWQSEHIAAYFTNAAAGGTTPVPGYNPTGRAYPDISVLGHNYIIIKNGSVSVASGTSASAPVFAGMVALVNAKRFAAGKSALGWINPSLYALSSSFVKDITFGHNKCTAYGKVCCAQGFTTTTGWDPVTGLGSLNFTKFEAAFFALGDFPNAPSAAPSVAAHTPSTAPVVKPSVTPTVTPTVGATINSGWLYGTYHYDSDCSGDSVRVEGWKTGQCFAGYNSAGRKTVYFKYSCDSDFGYIDIYSDSHCLSKLRKGRLNLGCSYLDYYYSYGDVYYSYSLQCNATSSIPIPNVNSYAVMSAYDSITGCAESALSTFTAFQNDFCFQRPNDGISTKYSYPKIYSYAKSSTCTGTKTTTTLTSTCDVNNADDTNIYYYSYGHIKRSSKWWKYDGSLNTPSISPSKTPSRVPTAAPSVSELYVMSVTQVLNGVSASQFNSHFDANSEAFAASVADCLDATIGKDDVSVVSVTDVSARRRSRLLLRSLADGDSVDVDYTVSYNIATLGYSGDPDGAYDHLLSTLIAAVSGSDFDTYLAENSVTFDATDLTSVTTGDIESSRTADDNGGMSQQTRNIIIGVVVGVGGCLLLVCGLVYACFYSGKGTAIAPAN